MAAIAYLRVSTQDQADSGAGLAAQHQACEAFAFLSGLPLTAVYEDRGVSGAKGLESRPGLLEAISVLNKDDVLLVAKRDRLGRDPVAVAMIESAVNRKGARVISSAGEGTEGDNPHDVLMRRMIDAFAEYERLIIGARTRSALQSKRRNRERVGSVPYGFSLDRDGIHLKKNPAEQKVIVEARRLRKAGFSLRAIASELAERGFKSRKGNGFAAMQVKRMLESAA